MRDTDWAEFAPEKRRGAVFSDNREYRYRLWRAWDLNKPAIAFVMLNPSTADEVSLDPTCRRCRNYAEDWGYGKLIVGNIFALRSTDPNELYEHPDPVGPENDKYLREVCADAEKVIAAWGNHGQYQDRGREVAEMLDVDLYALDTNNSGEPVHPLYQPSDIEPVQLGGGT